MPVKLRKSCDACSETKLGCSREHPRCARCAKRGLDCVYGVAKRAGRTCGSSRSKTNNPTSTLTGCPSPRSTTAHMETTATPPVEGIQSTMDLHTDQDQFSPSFQEMLAAMNSVAETSPTSMQPSQFLDLDELMASAMPLDNPTDFDAFGTGQSPQFGLDLAGSSDYSISSHSNFGKFGSFGSSNNFFATSGEARSTQAGMTTPVSSHGGSVLGRSSLEDAAISKNIPVDLHTASLEGINRDATDKTFPPRRPCECLTRSLTLLSQLPPDPPSGSILDEDFDISINMLDVDQVIAQNKKTSEVIRAILKCSCASDGYLLVILSLAVFKMLTWYSAAAAYAAGGRRQSRMVSSADWSNQNPDAMDVVLQAPSNFVNDFDCEGEELQRIVCQQVLSKLHDVQLTVVALSEHLLKIGGSGAKSNTTGKSPCQAASARIRVPGGNAHGLPLSRELAQTLEADMRKRLSASSKAIVERLRRR